MKKTDAEGCRQARPDDEPEELDEEPEPEETTDDKGGGEGKAPT